MRRRALPRAQPRLSQPPRRGCGLTQVNYHGDHGVKQEEDLHRDREMGVAQRTRALTPACPATSVVRGECPGSTLTLALVLDLRRPDLGHVLGGGVLAEGVAALEIVLLPGVGL